MMTSLMNRITGVAMTAGLYGLGIGVLLAPDTVPHYLEALQALQLGPLVWLPVKTVIAFPLTYHALNGLRHVNWDFMRGGYEIKTRNTWSQVGTLQVKRMMAGAVRYENQIYVVGGFQEDQVSPLQIERWNLDEASDITGQEFIGMELTNFFKPFVQLVPADFCVKTK